MNAQEFSPEPVFIDGRPVGPGRPAYIVAEIGINHNGDMDLAKKMIDEAARAGADAVKFQNYRTEDFVPDRAQTYTYVSQGRQVTEVQYDMFKRCELSREDVIDLAAYCRAREIGFHGTPTGRDGIADLVAAGAGVIKNGSDFLSNLPLVRAMGETGLPTVLSTGMAVREDIDDAVKAFRETGNGKLILLHCTSSYPTPDADVNVVRVRTLRESYRCLSGFSDHSEGISAAMLSVAYGACWIEKHFTLDRNLPGPDHRFSMDPTELAALVGAVRRAEAQVGTPEIETPASEKESRARYRLSCAAARDLPQGSVIDESVLVFRRPGTGILPKDAPALYGRRLKKSVNSGHMFTADDFE